MNLTWPEVVDWLSLTFMFVICVVGGGYIVAELGAYVLLKVLDLI